MTDDAKGSATVLEPNAGDPAAANGANAQKGSSEAAADPFAGLEKGHRDWIESNGLKDLNGIVQKARWAEGQLGTSVKVPGADAKPEEWQSFFRKAGAPETADGYEFTRPEGIAEEQFNADAKGLKEALHKMGTPKVLAGQIADFVFSNAVEAIKADEARSTEAAKRATTEMEAAFGGPVGSDQFKGAVLLCNRVLGDKSIGGDELMAAFKDAGLMAEEGYVLDSRIGKMLWNIGKQLYREGSAERGDPAQAGNNPFRDGPDKGNMTEQNRLIKADPAKAQRLMTAAGRKPEEWGLKPLAA